MNNGNHSENRFAAKSRTRYHTDFVILGIELEIDSLQGYELEIV